MDNQHDDNDPAATNENEEFGQFGPEGGDSRVDELDYYDQQDADDAAERALGVVPAFDPTHDRDDPDAIDPADRALASQAGDWTRRGRLFSLEPARGEPDTRAIYDPEDAHTAVDEVMEIIATRLAPDGSPLAQDRNELLYGFVHVLNAQSERLQKRVDNMAREIRELIHAQDGSEVRDNDLSQKTDEARNLYDRALAFDRLTNTAALAYERFTDLVWSARERHKSTFSLTEPARAPKVTLADHLRARTWLERTQGTRIAVASGQRPGRELVWATLSRLRNEHPDLVVVTGGNKEGADRYAAEWAKQCDVPLDIVKPDFDAPDFNAELKARNTRIVHHRGEKGRKEEGAAIDGLVVFPGARTGVPGDLVAKARQARVPIAEIENATQILNARGPLMPGYKLDHNEFRSERDPGDTDPARGERRIINAAIAAQTHGPESPRQIISFAINMLAERVTADGVQLRDEREKLLWGIGNVFYRQIERLNAEARHAASDIDLTPEAREAISRDYDARRNGFIELFREARQIYSREARQPWNADSYARLDHTHTLATLEAESFLKQVEQHRHEAIYRNGQYVVAAGGRLAPEQVEAHRPIVDRYLDKLLDRYPDLVLVHGGHQHGYDKLSAEWAERNNIPQIKADPEFTLHGRERAPTLRNEKVFKNLQIRGLIAFGTRGALVEDWIARAGNAVWRIDPAAELANLPAPVLAETPDRTWERIRTDYAGLCQATDTRPHLFPYQEGFDDFRGLVAAAIEAKHHPEQYGPKLNSLRETLDTEAGRRDTVMRLKDRVDGLTERLDDLKEWVDEEPGRPVELAPGFTAWLRDRDATIAHWKNATRNPELKDHLPRLGDDAMKAEIDRLSNPDLPALFHPQLETGDRHMDRVNNLYEHALAFVNRDPNLVAYSPHFEELRQTVRQVADELVSQPDQRRDLERMHGRLQTSSKRQEDAAAAARDLNDACTQVLGFQQWAAKTEKPVHEAPNFKEWRDSADEIAARCEAMRSNPELAAHLERAGASAKSTEVAISLLRDERFQRPVVPELPVARQAMEVREEAVSASLSA